jgi:hypothetical protein
VHKRRVLATKCWIFDPNYRVAPTRPRFEIDTYHLKSSTDISEDAMQKRQGPLIDYG